MNYKRISKCLLTVAVLFSAQIHAWGQSDDKANQLVPSENVILQWNRVLQETIRTPGQHPSTIFPVRSFAMMHAAMFDAVNSIVGEYDPYLAKIEAPRRASAEAAQLRAVGLSSQRESAVLWETDTVRPLGPMLGCSRGRSAW